MCDGQMVLIVAMSFTPTLRNFVASCPHAFPCVLYLKNEEEKRKKNEGILAK
jgi:hypothetical protein